MNLLQSIFRSKKGMIMHWMVFFVFAAFLTFVALSSKSHITTKVSGEWQTQFLRENYLKAETDLLEIDALALKAGYSAIFETAGNGGYGEEKVSECGEVDGIALWNKKDQWCVPDGVSRAEILVEEMFGEETLSEVHFSSGFLKGKGEKKEIVSEVGSYSYERSFSVRVGYSFEEYEQVGKQALRLINHCKGADDLGLCIEREKQKGWNVGLCSDDLSLNTGRVVVFCVDSPEETYLPKGEGRERKRELVRYQFALDFTPLELEKVENVQVESMGDDFLVNFMRDEEAQGYTLYYTNWPVAELREGTGEEIFSTMPQGEAFDFFVNSVSFEQPDLEECQVPAMSGRVILCQERVLYLVSDARFESGGEYYFGVAAQTEQGESEVTFVNERMEQASS